MKKTLLLSAAASLLLMSGASFAAPPDQPGHQSPAPGTSNDTMSAVKDTTGHAVAAVTPNPDHLAGFVSAAAVSDMYEVEAGKIAAKRSSNADVKAFAEKMVTAHTATTAKLKSILAGMRHQPAAPAHLDDRHQGMIDELRGAKSADFDNRYISQQIAAHKEALSLMQNYAKDGDNADVKTFAANTAPDVQDHLNMAEGISKSVSK